MRFDHGEKNHLLSTCYSFEKKKLQTLYYFFRLYLYFQDFFQVRKIAGQISRNFSRTEFSVPTLI